MGVAATGPSPGDGLLMPAEDLVLWALVFATIAIFIRKALVRAS